MNKLRSPRLHIDGMSLTSADYGDIYFQPEDGLAEVEHVFLDGNGLKERFAALQPGQQFVVGELGFGTGLNCLAALTLFQETAPDTAGLHIWSVEAHPIPQETLQRLLTDIGRRWPRLSNMAERLSVVYPPARPGQIRLYLTDRMTLTLSMGDAQTMLSEAIFKADAWFLDGFSPAKNPDMWSEALLADVYAHTKPQGSLATFTVAGAVRRGLSAAGFDIEKKAGFGRKRDMLCARKGLGQDQYTPNSVAIVGAGIAGASLAWQLRNAGMAVQIFDPEGPASGASGNPIGLVMPRLDASITPQAQFYRDAYLHALSFFRSASPDCLCSTGGEMINAEPASHRFQKVINTGLWASADLELAASDKLIVADGATLAAADAVRSLLAGVEIIRGRVHQLTWANDSVQLESGTKQFQADAVIVATGQRLADLSPSLAKDLTAFRGQVDWYNAKAPDMIRSDSHYIAPMADGLITGATYDPVPTNAVVESDFASRQQNHQFAEQLLGRTLDPSHHLGSRASIRAVTRDRHPVCGLLPGSWSEGRVWSLGGLGSRGLSTGPYLAAHIASRLTGSVTPLSKSQIDLVAPQRFSMRRARKSGNQ